LRRVSVNNFGFGGANTHVILDDAFHYLQARDLPGNHCTVALPGVPLTLAEVSKAPSLPKLLVWSASDEKAAKHTTVGYESFYAEKVSGDATKLGQLAFTLSARRSHSK
jgi:acyl transferase domain-containing protein